jgi:hypothetical protein
MTGKPKRKPSYYTFDFVTALSIAECRERLQRGIASPPKGAGSSLAPITQRVFVLANNQFRIERAFPGAIHPIRLSGSLDPAPDGDGTWAHGAITHDTENQVLIEGLIAFVGFFLLTALLFVRLRVESLIISLPMLLLMLGVMSLRWRALRMATEDMARWVRRRLYLTPEQVRRESGGVNQDDGETEAQARHDDQQRRFRHGADRR